MTVLVRNIIAASVGIAVVWSGTACANEKCAGVGLARIAVTDTIIHVGQTFVAVVESGGGCVGNLGSASFGPNHVDVRWSSSDSLVASVDRQTGLVVGRHTGDATIQPDGGVTTGPHLVLVHVR
jgi:hypothetical protein